MKKYLTLLFLMIVFLSFANLFSQDLTYVGAGKCKMCHKSEKQGQQFPLWEARKHSKAFQALSADTAAEKAKEAGVEGNPAESPKCLNCHGPITEFKQEGVTCEACHGPGSAYKKMSVMKDQAEAIKKGLTPYGSPEAIKKQCLKCHENAHGSSFDFDAAWEKVKHAKPEK